MGHMGRGGEWRGKGGPEGGEWMLMFEKGTLKLKVYGKFLSMTVENNNPNVRV